MTLFPAIDESTFMPGRFADQVVLITGAASGIGRCLAIRAAREGARVFACDINGDGVAQTADLIRAEGGIVEVAQADITSAQAAERLVSQVVAAFGGLDVAINNAGVMDGGDDGRPAPIHLASERYLRQTIEVNLFGTMYCCAAELRQFVKQGRGGSIVNVGSVTALTSSPGTPAYVASKHAVSGLTRAIAVDYAPFGVRCNSVNMSATETKMYDRAVDFVMKSRASGTSEGGMVRVGLKPSGLMGRNATPWEQAAAILFVASREASNMTGALVASDGGWTAY
jgi:NAD(P)-dependent dehydrogenase (short-subunit alcohol dehydrogenase family)